jgi:hypothetical protein
MLSKPGTPSFSLSKSIQPKPHPLEKPQIQNYEKISDQQPQNQSKTGGAAAATKSNATGSTGKSILIRPAAKPPQSH